MDVKERTVRTVLKSIASFVGMVGLIGLEPMTPALSRRCSNQLSYRPGCFPKFRLLSGVTPEARDEFWKMVEVNGFEPLTFCLQSRRSTN